MVKMLGLNISREGFQNRNFLGVHTIFRRPIDKLNDPTTSLRTIAKLTNNASQEISNKATERIVASLKDHSLEFEGMKAENFIKTLGHIPLQQIIKILDEINQQSLVRILFENGHMGRGDTGPSVYFYRGKTNSPVPIIGKLNHETANAIWEIKRTVWGIANT